jgi:predicted metal-dependent peptidase
MNAEPRHREARRRLTAARTEMVLNPDTVFFGSLVLKLKLVEEDDCGCPDLKECPHTAWTDGQSLAYYPRFIMSLPQAELSTVLVHEVLHCANGHPWRRDNRDHRRFNIACDMAINPVLVELGYKMPEGALLELEPSHKGKSAEWIYDRLPRQETASQSGQSAPQQRGSDQSGAGQGQQTPAPNQGTQGRPGKGAASPAGPQDKQGQPMQGNTPPGPRSSGLGQGRENEGPDKGHKSDTAAQGKGQVCDRLGEVRDAPTESNDPSEQTPTEADWQQAVQQAAVLAKGQGKLPGALKRFAKSAATSRIDWRSVLRRFVQEVAKADYSFSRPNLRYVARSIYLPSLRNHEVGVLAVAVDTSGSVDQVLLDQFQGEIRTIADEVKPRQVRVLYCDAKVQGEDVFERDDLIELHPNGGGGTDFRPVFERIEEWDEPPVAVVYLTDLLGTFPKEEPNVPTLWVTGDEKPRPVPFGEVVTAA